MWGQALSDCRGAYGEAVPLTSRDLAVNEPLFRGALRHVDRLCDCRSLATCINAYSPQQATRGPPLLHGHPSEPIRKVPGAEGTTFAVAVTHLSVTDFDDATASPIFTAVNEVARSRRPAPQPLDLRAWFDLRSTLRPRTPPCS